MSKKILTRLVTAAAIAIQLTAVGTTEARLLKPPPVKVPVPHPSSGGPDKKMSDMDPETCSGGGNQWLCTGKDGHTYGCTLDPDRCQRL
jgi:hypothetical protein